MACKPDSLVMYYILEYYVKSIAAKCGTTYSKKENTLKNINIAKAIPDNSTSNEQKLCLICSYDDTTTKNISVESAISSVAGSGSSGGTGISISSIALSKSDILTLTMSDSSTLSSDLSILALREWVSEKNYSAGNTAIYDGRIYEAIIDSNSTTFNVTDWKVVGDSEPDYYFCEKYSDIPSETYSDMKFLFVAENETINGIEHKKGFYIYSPITLSWSRLNDYDHDNIDVLNKLSESDDGTLLYNSKELIGISSDSTNAAQLKNNGIYVEDLSSLTVNNIALDEDINISLTLDEIPDGKIRKIKLGIAGSTELGGVLANALTVADKNYTVPVKIDENGNMFVPSEITEQDNDVMATINGILNKYQRSDENGD